MRLTEFYDAVKNGIDPEAEYSHIDIHSKATRETIRRARVIQKQINKELTLFT